MTNAPRGRKYSILKSQFAERATASDLPLTAANAPLATPALLDQVWRNNGLTLGRGLTPFSVVCEGHANGKKLKRDVEAGLGAVPPGVGEPRCHVGTVVALIVTAPPRGVNGRTPMHEQPESSRRSRPPTP
jgi:hypothetical protein